MSLFDELKRRNVFRAGAAYVVVAWLAIQVVATIFPAFGFSDAAVRIVTIVFTIGLIPSLIFAWAYELTPEGLKKEKDVDRTQSISAHTGKKLDRMIMVVLALALGYFAFDKFVLSESREASIAEEAHQEGRSEALVESYGEKSIAVLPFVNMSSDEEQEYFSDGISEELLNLLVKIPELRVISRSSSFSFKGKDIKLAEVARELNVAHILEGSVRKAGNQVRITVQLIEARSDTHLWSETYDRTLDDIFAIQDEIASAVVAQLKVTLLGAMPEPQKTSPEVYALYLQGRYFNNLRGKDNLEKALAAFTQALAIDPDYAPAWVGISITYGLQTKSRLRSQEQGFALALEAVERALAIDENMATAWASLAYLKRYFQWDWQGAKAAIDKALQLEPNNADVIGAAAAIASTFGQLAKSIELFERNVELDPLRLAGLRALGVRYDVLGRYDEALEKYNQVLVINPKYPEVRLNIAMTYLHQGNPERALAEMDKLSVSPRLQSLKASALFTLGEEMESQAIISKLLETSAEKYPMRMAIIYAWRGENDSAFEWLEVAFEQRDAGLSYILWSFALARLKSDPRYPIFLEKLGLLEAWKAMPPE